MLVTLVLVSVVVAGAAAGLALAGGWGLIGALLVYSLGGSLTLLLLALLAALASDGPMDRDG